MANNGILKKNQDQDHDHDFESDILMATYDTTANSIGISFEKLLETESGRALLRRIIDQSDSDDQ